MNAFCRLAVVVVLALCAPLEAQPPSTSPRASAGTAIVSGRITAADTGRPLRRARVQLIAASESAAGSTVAVSTNAQGRFELKDVAAGRYFVSASRAGYLSIQYGQRRVGERGLVVDLRAGATVERIDIALPRGAVLAGRITDDTGEPYPGVRVTALEIRYQLGRRVPFPAGGATTDDLGQYRMPGLAPGSYYVSASSSETWQNEKKEPLGYAVTYFPGVAADLAQAIALAASQEHADLDFRISVARPVRVRGRVLRSTGEPAPGESVSIVQSLRGSGLIIASTGQQGRTERDGTFEFRNVAPADYVVQARTRRADGVGESGDVDVTVIGDIDDLVVVTRAGSTITGSVVTDEGTPPPFPASGMRIWLVATDENVLPTVRLPAIDNDWSFKLVNVGGPFLFRVRGLPDEWMLDAVKLNEKDLTDVPYDAPTGGKEIPGLQVVITRKVGSISGQVVGADDKPTRDATVLVFPDDADLWIPGSRFVASIRPGSDGRFSIRRLPAGNYLAIARDFIAEGQWEDKAFLESVRGEASRLYLNAGGAETITLKLPKIR